MIVAVVILAIVVGASGVIGGDGRSTEGRVFYAQSGDLVALCLEAVETPCGMTLSVCKSEMIYHCVQNVVEIPREKLVEAEEEKAPELM